jgi:predicted enzyme related to lactoylglutathione lyase
MKVTGIDATYYTVGDVGLLKEFYAGLLGAAPTTEWEGRLAEWVFDDGSSFGLYGTEGGAATASGSAMFSVADVAKAVDEAKGRGTKFHENGDVTDTPVCHMAFGEDPEGNQFILHHRK